MVEGLERQDLGNLDQEEPVKAPTASGNNGRWERTLARYFTANRIPVTWEGVSKTFTGLHGYTIRRSVPMRARLDPGEALNAIPRFFRQHKETNLIVIVTNRRYGDDLEDSLVVMRLDTFTSMFATHINSDRERYIK
jgi:hypothetical protein